MRLETLASFISRFDWNVITNKAIAMKSNWKYKLIFIVTATVLMSHFSRGQDPQFSQFYSTPLYLNPAFTGNTVQGRVGGNYRKQWQGIPGAFTTYSFFYDHNLQRFNSGVGLLFVKDKAGSAGLKFTKIGGLYAYKMAITRKLFVNVGVRGSYATQTMNFFDLEFGDQLLRDDPFFTVETFATRKVSYFDMAMGTIFYSRRFWIGASFDHLTQPKHSFMGFNTRIPIKYSVHGGYILPIKKTEKGETIRNLTITANYKAQQDWDQLDIGSYFTIYSFVVGVWYRGIPGLKAYKPGYSNNDAIILLLGYTVQDYLSIGYSYDITISKLGLTPRGSHEISVIYEFAQAEYKRDQKRKRFMIPCAKFADSYGVNKQK